MKSILLITLLLFAMGAWGAVVQPTATSVNPQADPPLEWVRTADGWEKPATWRPAPALEPALHPAVMAGFLATAGVFALLAPPTRRAG